jgi:hypothetical protein
MKNFLSRCLGLLLLFCLVGALYASHCSGKAGPTKPTLDMLLVLPTPAESFFKVTDPQEERAWMRQLIAVAHTNEGETIRALLLRQKYQRIYFDQATEVGRKRVQLEFSVAVQELLNQRNRFAYNQPE